MNAEATALFLIYLSYTLPVIVSSVFVILMFSVPSFRKESSKQALLIFLTVWLINSVGLFVWELFMPPQKTSVFDFFYFLSGLLTFPLFYNYFVSLFSGKFLPKRRWLQWYALPVLLLGSWLLVILIMGELPPVYDMNSFLNLLPSPEALIRVAAFLGYVFYVVLVLVLSVKRYFQFKEDVSNDYSYDYLTTRNWVYSILVLFFWFAFLSLMTFVNHNQPLNIVINYLDTLLIVAIVLLGFRHKNLYSDQLLPLSELKTKPVANAKCVMPGMNRFELKKQFESLFQNDKIWRNSELSAEDVVRLLGTNRTYLSRLIKDEYNTNFRTIVNQYRINEAMSMLEKFPTISVADLYLHTGFSSTSSFNLWFRKMTSVSPSEYKLKCHNKASKTA